MEVTALCFTLIKLVLMLMIAPVQNSDTQKRDAVYLRVDPNRLQHFYLEPVTFICVGFDGLSQLKAIKNTEHFKPACDIKRKPTGSYCNIVRAYLTDRGQYWCETEDGEKSNTVNITVTADPVILESPALPVKEGKDVPLRCRYKTNSSDHRADFYKDGTLIKHSPTTEMTINNITKSHQGLYKCNISNVGTSTESQLVVGEFIPEDPDLPQVLTPLWIIVSILVLVLVSLLVGFLHMKKHTAEDDAECSTYYVVTKTRKNKDDDEASHEPVYADETTQMTHQALQSGSSSSINQQLTEDELVYSLLQKVTEAPE